jgi:hypothetical protein
MCPGAAFRARRGLLIGFVVMLPSFSPSMARAQYVKGPQDGIEQAIRDFALTIGKAFPTLPVSAVQTEAPASSGASPLLLDRAHLPALIGLALGQPLTGSSNGQAMTLSLDAFAIAAAWDSAIVVDPVRYETNSALRRTGGSLTLGAPIPVGDTSRAAAEVTDHMTGSLKLRLMGSRDRRDYWSRYHEVSLGDVSELVGKIALTAEYLAATRNDASEPAKYRGTLLALQRHPELGQQLLAAAGAVVNQVGGINDGIDHSLVISLDLTADVFAHGLGNDNYGMTFIAEMGQPFDLTFNAGYRTEEEIDGLRREELKMALAANGRVFGHSVLAAPLDWTIGGSGLTRNDHRTSVWSLNTKLDFPLESGLKVTASVTWANQPEISGEGLVRGNVGLSYQLMPRK